MYIVFIAGLISRTGEPEKALLQDHPEGGYSQAMGRHTLLQDR